MKINLDVLAAVEKANAKLLVVTKYWGKGETEKIIAALRNESCIYGWGENRVKSLEEKSLERSETHFIGRLQSRQLPVIAAHCETIHSLALLKHAEKLNKIIEQNSYSKLKVFIQVNVAADPAKEGIAPIDLPDFLQALAPLKNLAVVGVSSMGWGEFTESQKRQEFESLIKLRNKFIPQGLTSAGTSRDYQIALDAGIDIVRVGKGIVAEPFDV
ncbi:hypothetical protein GW756_02370 [bacterium]|nr:hypothetical protein [bacterium]NCQ55638.1 hypothetical protein [Candidatus Parcubacteria bacterium]NCS67463.1 hypothetical protein [Candidatus Peregrinibacteria bacterium]NCS96189.1 hypothetical protein [bacterium]